MDGVTKQEIREAMAEANHIVTVTAAKTLGDDYAINASWTAISCYERCLYQLLGLEKQDGYGSSEKSKEEIRPEEH